MCFFFAGYKVSPILELGLQIPLIARFTHEYDRIMEQMRGFINADNDEIVKEFEVYSSFDVEECIINGVRDFLKIIKATFTILISSSLRVKLRSNMCYLERFFLLETRSESMKYLTYFNPFLVVKITKKSVKDEKS